MNISKTKCLTETKPDLLKSESYNPNSPELLTLHETCNFLNLKVSKLRSMIFRNEIPVIRIGKCLRFNKADLLQWLNEKKFYSFNN